VQNSAVKQKLFGENWRLIYHCRISSLKTFKQFLCLSAKKKNSIKFNLFKVGIASKYMGPIILSLNYMMKDVLLFLITFTVIMLAFASGVAYIFNMASG